MTTTRAILCMMAIMPFVWVCSERSQPSPGPTFVVRPVQVASRVPLDPVLNWPQFRGPNSQGVSSEKNLPIEWSETKNVAWKVDLPGRGSSSPIIWGRRVFLTAYSGYGMGKGDAAGNPDDLTRHLLCFDRDTGAVLWKKAVPNRGKVRPYEGFMHLHGYASHTPVTDGRAVYCWFASHGAVAFDLDGKQLWRTEPFEMSPTTFGSGASPVLYNDLLLINANLEGGIFVALNMKTGREVWRRERIGSYTTPVIAETPSGPEMVLNRNNRLAAFDPRTGQDLWHHPHEQNGYVIAVPILHKGVYYAYNGYNSDIIAVRAGGRGDVSETHRLWSYHMTNNVPSPVYANGYIYTNKEAVLHCVRASDGKLMYKERLPRIRSVYASLLAADGMVYIIGRHGNSAVVKAGPRYELIAVNKIEDDDTFFNASPAVSNGKLYIRSRKRLYCIGVK